LGYFEMMNCVLQSLTENPAYELDPVIASWAMQLDKEREQKRKRQQSVPAKSDRCAKRKANLQSARVHEDLAQAAGHFYEHGKAFEGASKNEVDDNDDMDRKMPAQPTNKKIRTQTSGLKGFKNFDIDTKTGYPICPRTKKIIDGTDSYCKSCFSFGHERVSSTKCGKHKEWLAQNAMKKKQKEQIESNNEKLNEEDNDIEE